MTKAVSTQAIRNELMTSVIERVEVALADAFTMNQLLARGISYSEARERLIESTWKRVSVEAGL